MSSELTALNAHADPKYGAYGILVHQDKDILLTVGGNTITEFTEVYLKEINRHQIGQEHNYNDSDHVHKYDSSVSHSRADSSGWGITLSRELSYKENKLGVSGGYNSSTTNQSGTTVSRGEELTIKAHQTAYVYKEQQRIVVRKWWTVFTDGKECVVAADGSGYKDTLCSVWEQIIEKKVVSATEFTGRTVLEWTPIHKDYSDWNQDKQFWRAEFSSSIFPENFGIIILQRLYAGMGYETTGVAVSAKVAVLDFVDAGATGSLVDAL